MTRLNWLFFAGILLGYGVLGVLFAQRTPDWQAPDEPAHYNTIRQMAEGTLLPVIEMGDWDNDYLNDLKASGFDPALLNDLDTIQYEDHQPPLYYWLSTPVFIVSDGNLFALRLVSVLMGAITVTLSFVVVRQLLPQRPELALATMALVAFVPQHLAILGSVNNDALAGMWIALALWLTIRYLQGSASAWQLGLVIALIVITKTTGYFMAGVVLLAIIMRGWHSSETSLGKSQLGEARFAPTRTNQLLRDVLGFGIPAGIVALLYWGRNIATYGFPDFLGLIRHDEVVVGQPRTADLIADVGMTDYLRQATQTTFNSFWGQFGWMAAPMNGAIPYVYTVIFALVLIALSGLVVYILRDNLRYKIAGTIWITLGMVMLLAMLQFVYYNLTFQQFQGRYIFTALIPFAFGMALGVDTWRRVLLGRASFAAYLPMVLFGLFALLDFYLIWRVIPGALS